MLKVKGTSTPPKKQISICFPYSINGSTSIILCFGLKICLNWLWRQPAFLSRQKCVTLGVWCRSFYSVKHEGREYWQAFQHSCPKSNVYVLLSAGKEIHNKIKCILNYRFCFLFFHRQLLKFRTIRCRISRFRQIDIILISCYHCWGKKSELGSVMFIRQLTGVIYLYDNKWCSGKYFWYAI